MKKPPFVLLDHGGGAPSDTTASSLLITKPDDLIVAVRPEEVASALQALDKAVKSGYTAAGFTAYEVAGCLEKRLAHLLDPALNHPLIWYALSKSPQWLTPAEVDQTLLEADNGSARHAHLDIQEPNDIETWFHTAFHAVQGYLHAGDVFQVNLTYQNQITAQGSLPALYRHLRAAQPAPFSAYIDTGDTVILSVSPEQFLKRAGAVLETKPMKGTARRGRWAAEDQQIADTLRTDEKSQAENLMIVDLMRNDLSRVADKASVKVPTLFEVESYKSVHQMTSTIRATTAADTLPSDIFKAMFPCGSVTGAPKIRAMQIIKELEQGPRGVYCGTIARFSGTGDEADWSMNVPIRTAVLSDIDRKNAVAKGVLSVGAGLVADSEEQSELAECRLKAKFATAQKHSPMVRSAAPPRLIESLRLEPSKKGALSYPLLAQHLARITGSAAILGYPHQPAQIESALKAHAAELYSVGEIESAGDNSVYKVRLLLSHTGNIAISSAALPTISPSRTVNLAIAQTRLDSTDPWLFHKTTNRLLYDQALAAARTAGVDDLIFLNERDDVCESAIYSIFIENEDGTFLTPPLQSGLLPSITRSGLLSCGKAREEKLPLERVIKSKALWVGNAVRGLIRARIAASEDGTPRIITP